MLRRLPSPEQGSGYVLPHTAVSTLSTSAGTARRDQEEVKCR